MLDGRGALSLSFRNHLKDIPEAVSESQHVAYSHCELGGHWVDAGWDAPGGDTGARLYLLGSRASLETQKVISSTQDMCVPFPEFPERAGVPQGLD